MSKLLKILGIVFLVFIVIGVIASLGDDKPKAATAQPASETTTAASAQPVSNSNDKKYVEVYSFKGNGMKKSPVFELTGGNAKLVYKYNSGISDMGLFSAYVVDEGADVNKEGGIPEVMSQDPKEQSESSIQKSAGKYYLYVNATGKWEISVLEEK